MARTPDDGIRTFTRTGIPARHVDEVSRRSCGLTARTPVRRWRRAQGKRSVGRARRTRRTGIDDRRGARRRRPDDTRRRDGGAGARQRHRAGPFHCNHRARSARDRPRRHAGPAIRMAAAAGVRRHHRRRGDVRSRRRRARRREGHRAHRSFVGQDVVRARLRGRRLRRRRRLAPAVSDRREQRTA